MKKEIIRTDKAWNSPSPISQATRFGDLVFTSGQGPMNPKTGKIAEGGFKQEIRQALENLTAVLVAAGTSRENVLKAMVFLENMDNFAAYNEVWVEYFPTDRPARTAIQAGRMPRGFSVEIEAVACIPTKD
jgi:2-iminobutanoate/2-iminopropanoate deaminase